MQMILGISGKKNSGKDELCRILAPMLQQELDVFFEQRAFADQVKNTLCQFYYGSNKKTRITRQFIEDHKRSGIVPSGWKMNIRDAMVKIGDSLRDICPDIWVDILMSSIQRPTIITDVRYPNEVERIRSTRHGLVLRIIRPDQEADTCRAETSLDEEDKKYMSGRECSYDLVVFNDGSLSDLEMTSRNEVVPFLLGRWKFLT